MPEKKVIEHLHQRLAERVVQWREAGYPSDSWSAIAEILRHAWVDGPEPQLRFLRQAQFVALVFVIVGTDEKGTGFHLRSCRGEVLQLWCVSSYRAQPG